mmetsp:Transcript_105607/g.192102  ORF Transcript_105607/g.192102 Transcript_105607/m.192102 type:complete len:229 (+) Transcript_105607:315-1001(+)
MLARLHRSSVLCSTLARGSSCFRASSARMVPAHRTTASAPTARTRHSRSGGPTTPQSPWQTARIATRKAWSSWAATSVVSLCVTPSAWDSQASFAAQLISWHSWRRVTSPLASWASTVSSASRRPVRMLQSSTFPALCLATGPPSTASLGSTSLRLQSRPMMVLLAMVSSSLVASIMNAWLRSLFGPPSQRQALGAFGWMMWPWAESLCTSVPNLVARLLWTQGLLSS